LNGCCRAKSYAELALERLLGNTLSGTEETIIGVKDGEQGRQSLCKFSVARTKIKRYAEKTESPYDIGGKFTGSGGEGKKRRRSRLKETKTPREPLQQLGHKQEERKTIKPRIAWKTSTSGG